MTYAWILIIMMSYQGIYAGGVSVTTQQFRTEEACWSSQKRVMQMKEALHSGTKISATCVEAEK